MKTINNFLSYSSTGLYCAAGDFYIDPRKAVHKAIISHAHGDHATPNSATIYCTPSTKQIMGRRYKNSLRSRFIEVGYREPFQLNDMKITFYPAGHILGSAQIMMEYEGVRYLYTGDFKLQQDTSCEPLEFVETDYLITETTFANPDYQHPDPQSEIEKLNEITGQNILIGAYSVGKSQRVTQLATSHCSKKRILIHNEIIRFHEVYEQAGIDLGNWEPYRLQEFKAEDNCIYIMPPNWFNRFSRNNKVYKVFATGWEKSHYRSDSILHISDHADWNDLLKMIENTKPKFIFTLHGDGTHLKNFFEGKEIEVTILN